MFALDGYFDIFLCFVAGALMHDNKLGLYKTLILFSMMLVLGNVLFLVSATLGMTWLALIGRVLAGIGIESQNVAYYAILALWFSDADHGVAASSSVVGIRLAIMFSGFVVPLI